MTITAPDSKASGPPRPLVRDRRRSRTRRTRVVIGLTAAVVAISSPESIGHLSAAGADPGAGRIGLLDELGVDRSERNGGHTHWDISNAISAAEGVLVDELSLTGGGGPVISDQADTADQFLNASMCGEQFRASSLDTIGFAMLGGEADGGQAFVAMGIGGPDTLHRWAMDVADATRYLWDEPIDCLSAEGPTVKLLGPVTATVETADHSVAILVAFEAQLGDEQAAGSLALVQHDDWSLMMVVNDADTGRSVDDIQSSARRILSAAVQSIQS